MPHASISQAQLSQRCRHRLERRLRVWGLGAAVSVWFLSVAFVFGAWWLFAETSLDLTDGMSVRDIAMLFVLILFPFIVVLIRLWRRRKVRLSGVAINDHQLPGVQEYLRRVCAAVGVDKLPQLVIVSGSVPLSDSQGGRGGSIMVHYDLFEIARPNGDHSALRFAIAREVGRFAAGHHQRSHEMVRMLADAVPVVRGFLRRTESYTADRWGAVLAPDAAADFLGITGASKVLWQYVSAPVLAQQATDRDYMDQVVVLDMDVPPPAWRAMALADVLTTAHLSEHQKLTYWDCTVDFPPLEELAQAHAGKRCPDRGIIRPPVDPREDMA